MGLQINPVAAALLVVIVVTTGFFMFNDPEAEASMTDDDRSAYAGRPLPTIFYKNHTEPAEGGDAERFARSSDNAAVNDTTPQLIVHAVNATPEPRRLSPITSTRRARSSGGGGGSDNDDDAPAQAEANNTNTTFTPLNSTNVTNTTAQVNVAQPANNTNSTTPPANATNTTNETAVPPVTPPLIPPNIPPILNITNSTPPAEPPVQNTTNSTPPAQAFTAAIAIEAGFPQDQNVVLRCSADGAEKYNWDFGHGKDTKNDDGVIYHTFPESGTYLVECTAKKGSQEAVATKSISVTTPKKVKEDYPYDALITVSGEDSTYTFTCEDVGYAAEDFMWRFSGGSYESTVAGVNFFEASTKTITHTFPGPGEYEAYCEAASHDERMNKAYWEEDSYSCNSPQGCVLNTATEEIEIEAPEQEEVEEKDESDEEEDEKGEDEDSLLTTDFSNNETNSSNSTSQ